MVGFRTIPPVLLVVLAIGLGGCVSPPASTSARANPAERATATCDRLYFGRSIPGGGVVSDADWNAFVAEVVIPRFPDGFTVFAAHGHWRGADGKTAGESTTVLEIVHAGSTAQNQAIDEIAHDYIARFRQEAVLRVRGQVQETLLRGQHAEVGGGCP